MERRPDANIWILSDRRYLAQCMPTALIEWLRAEGHPPEVVVADAGPRVCSVAPLDEALIPSVWARLQPGDVVVTRSRDVFALSLLEEAEARRCRPLDAGDDVQRVRQKATCALHLARRGVPVPPTLLASEPSDLDELPASAFPLVIKPVLGDNAQGVRVVADRAELEAYEWRGGPLIAQAYVDAGGFDTKVYVVGDRVWATRRPGPLSDRSDPVTPVPLTPALRRIADGCREEFGLRLFGVDVLESEGRLAVVDVNEFPNYTGVVDAAEAIGELVLAEAGRTRGSAPERLSA